MIKFGPAQEKDLSVIMEIENSGFSNDEAATKDSMLGRIKTISDTFIVAYDEQRQPLGYVVGSASHERYISDELFEKTVPNSQAAKYQTILSLAVAPDKRGSGLAGQLLEQLAVVARKAETTVNNLNLFKKTDPFL